ncbi:collagen alpha-2(IV) chain-like isoform X4 [Haliotis rubra]|uniref:collagen alpha-2(IV) chain-like isoform X3 n=1 Tax=Haliotis rubra TaxID=36100 RepID=UPI001EE5BC62|nr:collagen alpha-2(IV) chain-like isoform X3 [Haliotis rubra]XP_046578430.1 collagen alpha-2(IV) chain-like isoform X4 [Haliotis rubra]
MADDSVTEEYGPRDKRTGSRVSGYSACRLLPGYIMSFFPFLLALTLSPCLVGAQTMGGISGMPGMGMPGGMPMVTPSGIPGTGMPGGMPMVTPSGIPGMGMPGGMPMGTQSGMPGMGMPGGMPMGMPGGLMGGMASAIMGRRGSSFRRSPFYLGAKQLGCSYGIDMESMLRFLLPRGCSPGFDFCPAKFRGRRCVQAGAIGMCCPLYVNKRAIDSTANMILMTKMAEMFAV